MRTFELFCVAFLCLCPMAWASSGREPCRSPAKTSGMLCVTSTKDDTTAWGEFDYDSSNKFLRFVEDSSKSNKSSHLDILIHFEKDVFYELDSKNESCKKRPMHSQKHPMEVPIDATHVDELYLGSPDKADQGLRVRMWSGNMSLNDTHHSQAHYSIMTTSCGCITVSCTYHSEKNDLVFSFFNVKPEADDQMFNLPDYCDNVSLEEDSDDHSFFDLFHE
ncbi:ependymin [Clarias gariepinus]